MKNKIVITAGGTSEKIDNVRKITNNSTGKLGFTIANKLLEKKEEQIEKIYYICSKNSYKPDNPKIQIIEIFDTKELKVKVEELLKKEKIDYFIHSMAVSDYAVDYVTTAERLAKYIDANDGKNLEELICQNEDVINENKISSNENNLIIKLKKNPKIISIIKEASPKTFLVGFKLLDNVSEEELIEVATKLRDKNNCDLVVANDLQNIKEGNHKAFIINKENNYTLANGKEDISIKLLEEMFKNDKL